MPTAREIVEKALKKREAMKVRTLAQQWFFEKSRRGTLQKRLIEELSPQVAKAIVEKNVNLIKTIDEAMFPKIVQHILRVLRGRETREELETFLEDRCLVSAARASLIADDQIKKATEACQLARWMRTGFTKVMWKHGGSKEYREYHKRKWDGHKGKRNGHPTGLNGFIFPIATPPIIDEKTGERGYPGQCIGCRCFLTPYD